MKKLLIFVVLIGAGVWGYMKWSESRPKSTEPEVGIGSTVEEVEKVFGAPIAVLPNFGRELRTYKGKSGQKYMFIIHDGKVEEIQQ